MTQIRGSKNLGLVKAIHAGVNPPLNKKIIWFDENLAVKKHKYYDFSLSQWRPFSNGDVSVFGIYTYLAYASDCDGSDFSFEFNDLVHTHISIITSPTQIELVDLTASLFSKKWLRFCDKQDGVKSKFYYLGFADDVNGTNFSLEPTYETSCPGCKEVETYLPINNDPILDKNALNYTTSPTNGGINIDFEIKTNKTIIIGLEMNNQPLEQMVDYCIEVAIPASLDVNFYVRLDSSEVGGYFVETDGTAKVLKFKKTNQSSKIFIEFMGDGKSEIINSIFVKVSSGSCCDENPTEVCIKNRSCFSFLVSDEEIPTEELTVDKFSNWFCLCCDKTPINDINNIKQLIWNLFHQQEDFSDYVENEITNILQIIANLTAVVENNQIDLTALVNNAYNTLLVSINGLQSQINSIVSTLNLHAQYIEILNNKVDNLISDFSNFQNSSVTAKEKVQFILDTLDVDFNTKRGVIYKTKIKEENTVGVTDNIYTRNGFVSFNPPTITSGVLVYTDTNVVELDTISNLVFECNRNQFNKIRQFQPKLIIEKYKDSKRKGLQNINPSAENFHWRKSGYKRDSKPLAFRPDSITLNNPYQVIDFGQEHYFSIDQHFASGTSGSVSRISAKGLGNKFRMKQEIPSANSVLKAWLFLRFRVEITYSDGTTMISKPLGNMKMIMSYTDFSPENISAGLKQNRKITLKKG